ncbi:uncharacterized protein [Parasteatoda tepidariorum]|uniref:uncharacterized protein isoform X2 n=1 Tax=Parasteatoda tepidariorum TaxID=114398 RepID=UPI00077FCD84|nr:uncharacterized protein LOC107452576 isoform X2 [Parasteatoda tepidariorum]
MNVPAALVVLILLLISCSEGGRVEEDTEVAMEEMRNLFRSLFPILPEQTHFFWKTNHRLATIHKTASYKEEPDGGMFPWRLQIDFRKRGPDCMRKCITQGVLHPVQCHSLC